MDRGGAGGPQPVGGALPQQLLHREIVGVQPAAEPGDRDAQAVGHRGVEPDAGVGRGHLLHGTDDPLHPRQQLPQPLLGRQPVRPDQAGLPEIAEGADRRGHELVRDHAAAHQTVVAVPEVVRGDRRTRSHEVVDLRRRRSRSHRRTGGPAGGGRPGRGVLPRPSGSRSLPLASRSRADSTAPAATTTSSGADREAPARAADVSDEVDAGDAVRRASVTIRSARVPSRTLRFPVAAARASTVLCEPFLASTGQAKPGALPARGARRPPVVRRGVDRQRHRHGGQPDRLGTGQQPAGRRGQGHRCHRVRPRTSGRPGVGFGGAADPDLVLGLGVERLHLVVADRPVGQRAAVRHPVRAGHGEVLRHEPPRLRAVHPGAAAERVGVAAVARIPGRQDDRVRAEQQGARVLRRRAQRPVVQSAVGAGVAQVIASQISPCPGSRPARPAGPTGRIGASAHAATPPPAPEPTTTAS